MEYAHGALTEWYLNDDSGLKQGFTIETRPEDLASAEPLRIELAIATDLQAEKTSGNSGFILRGPAGTGGLKYGAPQAVDANGAELPVSLELKRIEADDPGSR